MLSILTYNVRGITSVHKQSLLREWLKVNPHDIVLLQELHIVSKQQLEVFKHSFTDYAIFCSLGTWSAGGVVVMIKHNFSIVDSGVDHCGRIAYAKIIINNCPITLASVYAPTQVNERCEFFKDLHLHIPASRWMVIGGDFNCIAESTKDRLRQEGRTDKRSYRTLNSEFLQPLSLIELYRSKHPRSIAYSFHNESRNIHSRIDFFFGTKMIRKNILYIAYTPVGISDHDGISLRLSSPPTTATEYRRWICNGEVTKRPSFLPRFQKIWNVFKKSSDFNDIAWWLDLKTSLILLLQDEQKRMIAESRNDIKRLQERYRILATNTSTNNFMEMEEIRDSIREVLVKKVIANNHGYRERSTQELGEIARSRLSSTRANQSVIHFLNHPLKGRVDEVDDMLEVATSFYQDLYQEKQINTSSWNELFADLPKLSEQDRELLDQEISTTECFNALRAIPDQRSPGEDGITADVWLLIFPIIGSHYVQMINTAKTKGQFHPEFLRALLTLLKKKPKSDGLMKDFRPISLMNIDYKILSKVLSTRLRKVIGNIIHRDQSCSIPGRTIQDNIILIRSIIEYQRRIRDPIGIILWDMEKAFDRVNHQYLVGVLKAFGFTSNIINWIKLLYANGSFRIKLNNYISTSISFSSGVRQGCSLSGLLFVICLEPLLHRIRSNQLIPGVLPPGSQFTAIRQIIYPSNREEVPDIEQIRIKTIAYADDVNTIVRNRVEERLTIDMFNLYSAASGAKVNSSKTEILWISDWLTPPHFEAKINLEWCIFLGIPMDTKGEIPPPELEKKLNSIKQQIGYWSLINLSLNERVTVLKVFILSQLVYWLSLAVIPKKVVEQLQKMFVKFFWSSYGPRIHFKTIIGHKRDGGYSVPHFQSMIEALRIKCGTQLINPLYITPWKFYALIETGFQLRQYAPRLWSNLIPHIEKGVSFFHEVASHTAKWLKAGGNPIVQQNQPSFYWQLVNRFYFRQPVSVIRSPHLKNINFFKLLRESLPSHILDFWMILANYGIHTRSRTGHNDATRQCHLCNEVETPAHLFTKCPSFDKMFICLNVKLESICSNKINKTQMDIIYLKEIHQLSSSRLIRKNIVFMIGNYLHSIWKYRNIARHQCSRNFQVDPSMATRLFLTSIKRLPFDVG